MKAPSVLLVFALVWAAAPVRAETAPSPSPSPTASPDPNPSPTPWPYADMATDHWAAGSVRAVAVDHDWMATGTKAFRPADDVSRRELARAIVRGFASADQPDQSLTFADLSPSDPDYPAATVAVRRGWFAVTEGRFAPDGKVSKVQLDRMLVAALGAQRAIAGLASIHQRNGNPVKHASTFAAFVAASYLGLHHNYSPDEGAELMPWTPVRRQDAAHGLARAAAIQGGWQLQQLARFNDIAIGDLTDQQRTVVEFAFAYAGYPYVWAGEWSRSTTSSYCCGVQLAGGFDCSGYAWWVMRAAAGGWDNSRWRAYPGWALPQRTSMDMAKATPTRIAFEQARPLDLLFFDADSVTSDGTDWASVDHVGINLGNGWMVHSSGSRAGVSIDWVGDGWWRSHFRWARRFG